MQISPGSNFTPVSLSEEIADGNHLKLSPFKNNKHTICMRINDRYRAALAGICGTVLMATVLHATLVTTDLTNSTAAKKIHKPVVDPVLTAQLAAVEKLPTIAADAVPRRAVVAYYSAQNLAWPPLPENVYSLPMWDLGGGRFVVDDLTVNYQQGTISVSTMTANGVMALDVPLPPGGGGGSTNDISPQGQSNYILPPGLKLTPPVFTNGNVSVNIYEHDPSLPYDVYFCTNLLPQVQWNLVSHGVVGQTNFVFANSFGNSPTVFFIAASGADTDGDGLSDGYEALISHTNPFKADTDGDGMSDGWELAHGLNPLVSNQPYTPPATTLTITKPTNRAVIP